MDIIVCPVGPTASLRGLYIELADWLRMEACSRVQGIVAILFLVVGFCFSISTTPVYICSDHFDLRIPTEPDSSEGWIADAVVEITNDSTIYNIDCGVTLTHTKVLDFQINQ